MVNVMNGKRRATVNSVEEKALILYRQLLVIMEKENREITERGLEGIEHFISQKVEILREVESLRMDLQGIQDETMQKEFSGIIKRMIDLNESSAHAIRKAKNDIHNELSTIHKGRSAFMAYSSRK